MYTYIYITYKCNQMYVYTYVHTYVSIHTYIHIYICTYILCVYIYIRIYIYAIDTLRKLANTYTYVRQKMNMYTVD